MTIAFQCPSCGQGFKVDRALAGKKGRCKACGNLFMVPSTPAEAAPPRNLKTIGEKSRPKTAKADPVRRPEAQPPATFDPYLDDDLPSLPPRRLEAEPMISRPRKTGTASRGSSAGKGPFMPGLRMAAVGFMLLAIVQASISMTIVRRVLEGGTIPSIPFGTIPANAGPALTAVLVMRMTGLACLSLWMFFAVWSFGGSIISFLRGNIAAFECDGAGIKFGWYGSGILAVVGLALMIPGVRTSLSESIRNSGGQVQASSKQAEKRPGNPAEVGKAVAELKSSDRFTRLFAALALKKSGVVPSLRQDVVQVLVPLVNDDDLAIREEATEALGVWGEHEEVPVLLKALDDWTAKKWNRWRIFTALSLLKDPSSAEAVVARITNREDRVHVHGVLKAIGPAAEPYVWKYLDHPDPEVRHHAYGCLQLAGSAISIPSVQAALRRMDKDRDAVDLMYARATLKKLGGSE
jgi:predicted Zn finger-like uncharacterized protein